MSDNINEQNRPPDKKPAKITSGQKRMRFADLFTTESTENVKLYLLKDVLIPGVKKLISEMVKNGIDSFLYGGRSSGERTSSISRPSYGSYYDGQKAMKASDEPYVYSGKSKYADILVESRQLADDVLIGMDEICQRYGRASIADLYDMVGIDGDPSDNNYGWTSMKNAKIVRHRDKWLIKMPRPYPID